MGWAPGVGRLMMGSRISVGGLAHRGGGVRTSSAADHVLRSRRSGTMVALPSRSGLQAVHARILCNCLLDAVDDLALSTVSGDAPGPGMLMTSTGGSTSGTG